ncbi:hypothetical protein FKW77_000296 [Venturia effusa]|uniref:Cell wall mannoprotein PIR1-like C-terminal domain-containing protein n=1 Tax=Venturia effusa TaxID=50376 RepID=A0A517L4R7_9PEZI|nr:hypothetical protein FKW77_000296 [Venturia effusa]
MRTSYVVGSLALAATNALASPQGVTASIAPQAPAPAGCSPSYSGPFQITVQSKTTGSKVKRDALECTLSGGVLKDAQGRTGYIADNFQFQFDGPPQAGAIYTAGFSLCGNGSLALGGSAIWYQCLSGGFYNLYDRSWAPQCSPIYIEAIGYSPKASATQATDSQVAGTTSAAPIIPPADGPSNTTTAVSQQTDGQVNVTPPSLSLISEMDRSGISVSQVSDGQIQVHISAKPVSQITDGQIQVHISSATTPPVSELHDGQVYNPTPPVVPAPVSQLSDQQIQANAAGINGTAVSQKPGGQVHAPTPTKGAANVSATYKPAQATVNAAPLQTAGSFAVAGLLAVAAALL